MRFTLSKLLGKHRDKIERQLARLFTDAFLVQKRLIKTNMPLICDVGAHFGTVATLYKKVFPDAVIHAFEPFPDSYAKLRDAIHDMKNVYSHRMALSNKTGKLLFHSNNSSATNSLLETHAEGSRYWGQGLLETKECMNISSITLDDFCERNSIDEIDILKLDIQGGEYSALQGSERLLTSRSISLIYSEMIMVPTYQNQKQFYEYLELMDRFGYLFFDLYNPIKTGGRLIQADVIFVKPELINI